MSIPPREYEAGGAAAPAAPAEMIALARIRQDGHALYCLEVCCPVCGALLGKTFGMIGRLMFYNFSRVHQTLRVTPAMEARVALPDGPDKAVTDHVWTVEKIVTLVPEPEAPVIVR